MVEESGELEESPEELEDGGRIRRTGRFSKNWETVEESEDSGRR
jgi:hypothetical protein